MNDALLSLYHRLPGSARSAVASVRGFYLRSLRYGPVTDAVMAEALEKEYWSEARLSAYQEERLAQVLHRAATRVPHYREYWSGRRSAGDRASWDQLENWPVLDKELLRRAPKRFVADDRDIRRMFLEHTSGTTGKPLKLWSSRRTVQLWYGLSEARWRHWYGVSRNDRWAILGGQLVTPFSTRRPPYWVWNHGLHQLYMSSYHLAPDLVAHYLDALSRYRICYLYGYPSCLTTLAEGALRLGRRDIRMKVAIANAEPLFERQREVIAEAFGCPVRETYGMGEIAAAASECDSGQLHLWPEVGIVQVLRGSEPLPDGETGDLVCTSLLNDDMPLIRYRNGDRGALAKLAPCACGRRLKRIERIEGRLQDVLITPDGRCIGMLESVFKGDLPVLEAQVVQERLDHLRVRYVPASDFTADSERSLRNKLRERFGGVEITLESVDRVPRTANGKFRALICLLPDEVIERARAGELVVST